MKVFKNLNNYCGFMVDALKQARDVIVHDFSELGHTRVTTKDINSFGERTKRMVCRVIEKKLREHSNADIPLLIDLPKDMNDLCDEAFIACPLDGINNFLRCIPCFSTAIIFFKRRVLSGVAILNPLTDDWYCAYVGSGAFHNQTRMRVSKRPARLGLFAWDGKATLPSYCDDLSSHVRIQGSKLLDIAHTASGHFEGCFHHETRLLMQHVTRCFAQESGGFFDCMDHTVQFTNYDPHSHERSSTHTLRLSGFSTQKITD